MADMTLQYIAGFFDGEGTLCVKSGKGIQWAIAQSKKNGGIAVLKEIQGFLGVIGIPTSLYCEDGDRNHDMCSLYCCDRPVLVRLLPLLFPYLRVKRVLVQDVLRYIKLYPTITGSILGMLIREGIQDGQKRRSKALR